MTDYFKEISEKITLIYKQDKIMNLVAKIVFKKHEIINLRKKSCDNFIKMKLTHATQDLISFTNELKKLKGVL